LELNTVKNNYLQIIKENLHLIRGAFPLLGTAIPHPTVSPGHTHVHRSWNCLIDTIDPGNDSFREPP
jgi:hypothetical protein